ncbi:MAG TPA: TadE/TadG family type IV pilus assembly protein [Thermoguttaceae bacterium]|nr:TadE/TadG family type IV pilus assembly protein [Thermoguttaceae bacterium]
MCRKRRRGAAAVEFAVVAPIFFLMIFGMIEFGRMIMVQQLLTNASREGARLAVLDGSTMADVRTTVKDYLESVTVTGVTDGDIEIEAVKIDADSGAETVCADLASAGYGGRVTVTITIPFDQVSWLSSPMIMDMIDENMELSASTVMRRETVQ